MTTDAAARQRRSRAHRRGDHTLCDPDRCAAAAVQPADGLTLAEATALQLAPYLEQWPDDDPRAVGAVLAQRMAESLDAEMKPTLAREFWALLTNLTAAGDDEAVAVVTRLAVERAQRNIERLIRPSLRPGATR